MTDFFTIETQNRHIITMIAYEIDIPVDIDLFPFYLVVLSFKDHQCPAHGIAQVALFAIV